MKTLFRLAFVFLFLAGLLAIQPLKSAHAAGIVVNSNLDTTSTDGLCTLREAITNANNDAATYPDCTSGAGNDTITFASNYTITLGGTLPDVTDVDGLTITGNGTANTIVQAAASAGTATYRIIKINGSSVGAILEYMTFRYGVEASGGAINVASASLTLNYMTISDNQVNNSVSTGLNGGAISINSGSITINNSTLSNNSVTTSDTSTNVRGSGGAIFVGGGTVTLNNTTVSGNSAIRGGGGVFANSGTININQSTITNNTSNNADGVTAYSSLDGGGINRNAGSINLKNSIVAGNKKGVSSATDNDCNGTITSQGYNLTGSGTGCSIAGTGDITITPSTVFTSLLGSLADNGGQTYTHALVSGSAAVDVIPNGTNGCGSTYAADQRGGARPYNSSCDMGALEFRDLTVSTTGADSGNCKVTTCLTIVYAYNQASSGDKIIVAAGTYTETSEINMNPSSSRTITITGAGAGSTYWQAAASAGTATHRLFKVGTSSMALTVQNMTLRYGVEASGGAINVAAGSLTLNNVIISDNQVNNSVGTGLNGGAISVNGGVTTINNSAIINNSVTTTDTSTNIRGSGGGIFVGSGTMTLNNVTISGNSVIRGGGGLHANGGTVNINYSTIANNRSHNDDGTAYSSVNGGGINRTAGTINLKSSIVAGNKKGTSSPTDDDCNGTITSQGYNLTGSGTGCSIAGTGDVTVSASSVFTSVLGPLANNGGTTDTHLLYGGNAAQDAIPNGTNSCGSGTFTADQIDNTRPYNSNCDMGAYESQDPAPTVSISSTATSPTNTSPIPVTVTFSESVTGFTAGDISAGNATVSNFSGSGSSYSFDLTPSGDGSVTADIAAGVAQDSAYNDNTAASQFSISYDGTAPTVSMSSTASNPTTTSPIPVTVTFSESVTGFTAGDISAGNATVSNFSGSGSSYSFDLTPSGDGSVTADIAAGVAQDSAYNNNTAASQFSISYDGTAPTVSMSSTASNPTTTSPILVTVTFSESVTGFTSGDISVGNATVGNFSGSGASYSFDLTPSADGSVTADIAAGVASDSAGNNNAAATQFSRTYDATSPTVISSIRASSNPTNASSVDFTVTYSESVTGVDTSDFTLTTTGSISSASVSGVTGSGATRTVTVNTGSGSGTIRLDVLDDDSVTDAAGNTQGNNLTTGESYTIDKVAPTVSMSSTASDPGNISPIPVIVTFSESVTGFAADDITPGNATVGNFTGSGTTYTFDLTPSSDGAVTADIATSAASDTAGNTSAAATQFSRSYDATAPVMTGFAATSPSNSLSITITTFNASDTSGITDYLVTESSTQPGINDSGWTASAPATYSVSSDGSYALYPWAKDAAGNISTVYGSPVSVIVDSTPPTVVSIVRISGNPTNSSTVTYMVTFSEAVNDVGNADFSATVSGLSGASVVGVDTSDNINYGVNVDTGSGSGTLRLDLLDDDGITDNAGNKLGGTGTGNGNYTSGEVYTVDKTAPTVLSSVRVNPNPTNKLSVQFTVTFSEPVTGVGTADFSLTTSGVTGSSISSVSGSGTTRTITVNTGSGNGSIRLDIPVTATITDALGNAITALPYTSGSSYTINKTMTFSSLAAQDGWVLESSETSGLGGTFNNAATTFNLGDNAAKKQYRGILSFNTGSLPDNAVITGITLKVKKSSVTGGGNPVSIFQGFMVDIKKGILGTTALQTSDFQAATSKTYGPFSPTPVSNWYSINLTTGKAYINKLTTNSGLTQIRLRFKLDDNNNTIANVLSLFSGNAPAGSKPQLIITYYVP